MDCFWWKKKTRWYLVDKYRDDKDKRKWKRRYIVSFPEKPTLYKPQLILGDAREVTQQFKPNSIHLVVTSPPYFNLKEGTWDTYDDYMDMLNSVWGSCHNALNIGCRLCVNIGDEYADVETYGRHYAMPIHADIIKGCQTVGFDYMGAIIWNKRKRLRSSGGGVFLGSYPYPREFLPSYEYEYILIFKKRGRSERPSDAVKYSELSKLSKQEWGRYFDAQWKFVGEKKKLHSSAFPEELPKRLIRVFSFVGETVLDPFMGSGTTPLVAAFLGRKGIGIEINENYHKIAEARINTAKIPFNSTKNITTYVVEQNKQWRTQI